MLQGRLVTIDANSSLMVVNKLLVGYTGSISGPIYGCREFILTTTPILYDKICCLCSISHKICTRLCCDLLFCGYAIIHIEFKWYIYAHILQGYFTGTGAIVRLPQCQWSKPEGYGHIDRHLTTPKHSKARTVCILYQSASNHIKAQQSANRVHIISIGI